MKKLIAAIKQFRLELKWATNRILTCIQFMEAARDARVLEIKWKELQQKANDLAHQGRTEESFKAMGFVDGVKYCINREWKSEK